MNKIAFVLLSFILCSVFAFAQEVEEIRIVTYYPSPYGSYTELRSNRMAIGDNYSDAGTYQWGTSINTNADLIVQQNVGIGTSNPDAPLSFANSLGDKIQLYDNGSFTTYGFGVQSNNLQLLTTDHTTDITFNYGFSASATELMRIKGNGNVGIGITNPTEKLYVNGNAIIGSSNVDATLNGEGVFQSSSNLAGAGFIATPWVYARAIEGDQRGSGSTLITIGGKNGFTSDDEIGLVTNGKLKMLMDSNGLVTFFGLHSTSPGNLVFNQDSQGDFETDINFDSSGRIAGESDIFRVASKGTHDLRLATNSVDDKVTIRNSGMVGILDTTPSYTLDVNGTFRAFGITDSSDIRWKKNITNLETPLDKLAKLRGVRYQWNQEAYPDKNFAPGMQIGIIAQELEEQYPELVDIDSDGYKSIQYGKLTAVLLEGIKELKQENDILKQRIASLEENF